MNPLVAWSLPAVFALGVLIFLSRSLLRARRGHRDYRSVMLSHYGPCKPDG